MKDWNDIKSQDSWEIFKIMGEFVEGFERLSRIGPCVSIFGSARTHPDNKYYALAEELGGAHKQQINKEKKEGGASRMAKHFGGGSAKSEVVKEARRRANLAERKALLARRQAAAVQKELKESNLFNAKLLYVNKLMQQHDLNSKQQRAIVEALDNAKTLREAKLLYTSLTDSLRRRNTGRTKSAGSLNESLVRSGSGSNSTRSSAPAKSGVELDRWAILAGINNKK